MMTNIMQAFEDILHDLEGCALRESYFTAHEKAFSYLCDVLHLTEFQCVVIAILLESDRAVSLREMASRLGLKRVALMTHVPEIENLVKKRWLHHCAARFHSDRVNGYDLQNGVVDALVNNRCYQPVSLHVNSDQELMNVIQRFYKHCKRQRMENFYLQGTWIMQLIDDNPERPLCRKMRLMTVWESAILLRLLVDYDDFHDTQEWGVRICEEIENDVDEEENLCIEMDMLKNHSHSLIVSGFIETKCEDGMARNDVFVVTQKALDELLPDYTPRHEGTKGHGDRQIVRHEGIIPKKLFYNPDEQEHLDRISQMLTSEKLTEIRQRMAERGRRKGVTILLYGAPGTGKTEFVLQLCKATKRDCFHVDLSAIRSKWVGESEANIRQIFKRYNSMCHNVEHMPILLFNEADGIFTRRNANAVNLCDKSENTIQNIILEEMEKLDGILIATSNMLQTTMDPAMTRRFLYKMELRKPDVAVRGRIWHAMMPELSEDIIHVLAQKFALSGGEIENVVRKCEIDYFLDGKEPTLEGLTKFCESEKMGGNEKFVSGFGS